jgi:hypothetical protein
VAGIALNRASIAIAPVAMQRNKDVAVRALELLELIVAVLGGFFLFFVLLTRKLQ